MHPHALSAVATNNQETDRSFEHSWHRSDKPLSLTLTLQMNDQFFRQRQSADAHRNCLALLSTIDQTQSAHNEAATSTPPQRQVHSIEPSSSSLATTDDSLLFTHANAHPTQVSACDSADHSNQLNYPAQISAVASNSDTAESAACHTSDQLSTSKKRSAVALSQPEAFFHLSFSAELECRRSQHITQGVRGHPSNNSKRSRAQ